VENGLLQIRALQKTQSGPAVFDDDPSYNPQDTSVTRAYTSARLRTKNQGDWRYGRMEVRAKLPHGQGIWPAIWMLPSQWVYGGWPLSGEIDIMEAVNSNAAGGNQIFGTLHYGAAPPNNKYTGAAYTPAQPVWEQFHNYAVEWEAGEIRWYLDDQHFATQTQAGWFTTASSKPGAPFDQAFHLILNLAVGGNWPGNPNAQTQFPQTLWIDHVRVYRCSSNPDTGKGCSSPQNPAIKPLAGHPNAGLVPSDRSSFALPPLFSLFKDSPAPGLQWQSYNPDNQVQFSTGTFAGKSGVLALEKTGPSGNVFLNLLDGPINLSSWAADGELVFDLYIETAANDSRLRVKIDSGWPNTSDTSLNAAPLGQWREIRIKLSQLVQNGNSLATGGAQLASIINPVVLEPSGPMRLYVSHLRLVTP
jgi:hypothetical protein